jgi:hypothetical protein
MCWTWELLYCVLQCVYCTLNVSKWFNVSLWCIFVWWMSLFLSFSLFCGLTGWNRSDRFYPRQHTLLCVLSCVCDNSCHMHHTCILSCYTHLLHPTLLRFRGSSMSFLKYVQIGICRQNFWIPFIAHIEGEPYLNLGSYELYFHIFWKL